MRNRLSALVVLCSATIGVSPPLAALAASPESPNGAPTEVGSGTPQVQLAASVSGSAVVQYALRFVGYPYTTVGNSPSTGFSCIGFVSYVYQSLGINVPDDLGGAMAFASSVAFSDLQPGDVLFFQNTVWPGLSHTAIYLGGGRFVHAEWYNRGVVTSSFTNDPVDGNYWTSHYLGANRPWASAASPAIVTQPSQPAPRTQQPPAVPQANTAPGLPVGPRALVRVPALNVRVRPSLNAALSAVLVQGTRVVVLGPRWWSWYRVALPSGARGWVIGVGIGRGGLFRQVSALQGTRSTGSRNILARGNTSYTRSLTTQRTIGAVHVQVNGLRVHAVPSIGGAVVAVTGRGPALPVLGRSNGWIHVLLPQGGAGWISGLYTQNRAASSSNSSSRVVSSRATSRPTARGSNVGSQPGVVARVALNVRQRPSLGAPVVFIVPPGSSYRVVERLNDWAYVRTGAGYGGWMSATVLGAAYTSGSGALPPPARSSGSASPSTGARPTITVGVRIHARPGMGSAVLGLVAAGTHVQVLGSVGGWTRVRLPTSQTGYVYGTYVSR